ncbi:hypothetical protein [Nonomuraea sp. GTA35]|uniref:hypothetical protein n=1 Tax=Nonomuraea sp. GTA35 TaxID=1676746 RepID=UPI0035C175CE
MIVVNMGSGARTVMLEFSEACEAAIGLALQHGVVLASVQAVHQLALRGGSAGAAITRPVSISAAMLFVGMPPWAMRLVSVPDTTPKLIRILPLTPHGGFPSALFTLPSPAIGPVDVVLSEFVSVLAMRLA